MKAYLDLKLTDNLSHVRKVFNKGLLMRHCLLLQNCFNSDIFNTIIIFLINHVGIIDIRIL